MYFGRYNVGKICNQLIHLSIIIEFIYLACDIKIILSKNSRSISSFIFFILFSLVFGMGIKASFKNVVLWPEKKN